MLLMSRLLLLLLLLPLLLLLLSLFARVILLYCNAVDHQLDVAYCIAVPHQLNLDVTLENVHRARERGFVCPRLRCLTLRGRPCVCL